MNIRKLKKELKVRDTEPRLRTRMRERGTILKEEEFHRLRRVPNARRHPLLPLLVISDGREPRIIDLITQTELKIFKQDSLTSRSYVQHQGRIYFTYKLVAEAYFNRLVNEAESVHHINLDKHDNYFENLEILKHEEHVLLHRQIIQVQRELESLSFN